MSNWAEIRNDYFDEESREVSIDAWKTDDPNEEGEVITKINVDTIRINYISNLARTDKYAQEVIRDTVRNIKSGMYT